MKNPGRNEEYNELNSLNDELGSFGLEPPKHYRTQQSEDVGREKKTKQSSKRTRSDKHNDASNMTSAQKNAIHKKKRRLKKKVRIAFGITGLCLALIVAAVVCLVVFCKIETITVSGGEKYTQEQVLAVLPVEKGKNLFFFDSESAENKLCENLPYIYSVDIKRKLPSTVVVNISQADRLYYIQNSESLYTYIDDTFKTVEVNAVDPPENGIEIKKIAVSQSVLGQKAEFTDENIVDNVEKLMAVVNNLKLEEVTAIYSESNLSNYLVYENRIIIKIGEINDAENKVYSALTAIEKLNEVNPQAEGTMTSIGGKQVYFTEQK